MKITLYKEDFRDSGWFELLKELEQIPANVEYDDHFNNVGDLKEDSEYAPLFSPTANISVVVLSFDIEGATP